MLRVGITVGLQQLRRMAAANLPQIKDVDIDPSGTFKYILIQVASPSNDGKLEEKLIVRGYGACAFHGSRTIPQGQ